MQLTEMPASMLPACVHVLEEECSKIESAHCGERNDTLNRAAFAVGQLVERGKPNDGIDEPYAKERLIEAGLAVGLERDEVVATVKSGIGAGKKSPRARAPIPTLTATPVGSMANVDVRPREWLVRNLVPARDITSLYGDGGTGKSLVALQLAISVATGRAWLNQPVAKGSSLFLTAEDTSDELHRRLDRVLKHEELDYEAIGDRMHVLSLAGQDAILGSPERGNIVRPTGVFEALKELLDLHKPSLLVLDTLADLFGGEENQRAQARQFITMLRGLCLQYDVTILLLAHPSLSGMASGSGSSGNTGWTNSVRSRLYMERIGDDPDMRQLSSKKANYARAGVALFLRWNDGAFIDETETDFCGIDEKAERVFLKLLREHAASNRRVSHHKTSNYAPKVFAKHSDREHLTQRQLETAMERLFSQGRITVEEHGPPSTKRTHIAERVSAN